MPNLFIAQRATSLNGCDKPAKSKPLAISTNLDTSSCWRENPRNAMTIRCTVTELATNRRNSSTGPSGRDGYTTFP